MKTNLIIGTRQSLLAMWQSNYIAGRLREEYPGCEVTLKKIVTKGDRILDVPLAKIGGKGLFTKEIEQELLDGTIDLAVHSLKDMPTVLPEGLCLTAITERASAGDAFVSNKYNSIEELPEGSVLGTSSLRRRAQLLARRPDLKIVDLRGNVDTRLKKLDEGQMDAIILAAAGLKPPAIFIVGNVVKLREQLRWYDNKPLFGKTIVVTRARSQASALTKQLEAEGAKVIEAPSIKIVPPETYAPLDEAIKNIHTYKWLVLTSANGVKAFFARLAHAGLDARALASVKIAAIGCGTAKALQSCGVKADLVPCTYKAEELAEALAPQLTKGDKVLIPRAKEAREVLPETLRKLGVEVDVITAYETAAVCENAAELMEALQNKEVDMVTFTSSSTVTNFLKVLGGSKELLEGVALAAIGPVTAETCRKNGLTPAVTAGTFTIDGLTDAIKSYYIKE